MEQHVCATHDDDMADFQKHHLQCFDNARQTPQDIIDPTYYEDGKVEREECEQI
ncbi:hypothetical protein AGMMS49992_25620 [Clostridia bacterium]|nr:hypothetical protein AGMMS49992_25620 [Clostridia bacterium]